MNLAEEKGCVMAAQLREPVKVFVGYAPEDAEMWAKLEKHLIALKRAGLATIWSVADVHLGEQWEREVEVHLLEAEVALLLISSDFLSSDYCYQGELAQAIERHKKLILVLLRPVDWQGMLPPSTSLVPLDGETVKAVTSWDKQDEALQGIALTVRETIVAMWDQWEWPKLFSSLGEEWEQQVLSRNEMSKEHLLRERLKELRALSSSGHGQLVKSFLGHCKLVMVIDDSLTVQKTLATVLLRDGFDYISFGHPIDVFHWLDSPQGRNPDLVIIDIGLPKMDGYEVARRLKAKRGKDWKRPAIVMLSSRDGIIDRLRGYQVGARVYITKPYRTMEVLGAVHMLIGLPNTD